MNILSISSDRKVFEPGSAVRARLLEYGRLVESMHVIVFAKRSLGFTDESFPPNIFLYPTNSFCRFGYIPLSVFRAYRLKKRGVQIDLITTQDPFEAGVAGLLIARILGARLHVQVHTDFMSPYFARESFMNRARVLLAKFVLPRAHAIRVVSERIKDSLSTINYQLSTVSVLPIFVDVEQEDRGVNRTLDQYSHFSLRILMASRLTREKNIGLAIEAMKILAVKHPRVGLIIVGDGPEREMLSLKVKSYSLEANVVFEGWQSDLSSYYKTANVFLLTSNYEGYGMTVVEALLHGCPVVMTDVGCAGDIVRDGENGLVVPVNDVSAVAHALERIVSGKVKLEVLAPKLVTKEEYLMAYKKSWEDALA